MTDPPPTVTIAPADATALPDLLQLGLLMVNEAPRMRGLTWSEKTLRAWLRFVLERGVILTAVDAADDESDGVIVGALVAGVSPGMAWLEREAEELAVYVVPTHRRRGIGRALVRAYVAWAEAKGAHWAHLEAGTGMSDDAMAAFAAELSFQPDPRKRWVRTLRRPGAGDMERPESGAIRPAKSRVRTDACQHEGEHGRCSGRIANLGIACQCECHEGGRVGPGDTPPESASGANHPLTPPERALTAEDRALLVRIFGSRPPSAEQERLEEAIARTAHEPPGWDANGSPVE